MKTILQVTLFCVASSFCNGVPSRDVVGGAPISPSVRALDDETVVGAKHLSTGYPPRNRDGSVNAVIEIPAGTTAKFEVDDHSGSMNWGKNREDGSRREIDYLPFLVNYGMIPRTLADDGDPLDIVVLGRGIERGHIAQVRVIAVLKMGHDETRDDKLIAVPLEESLRNGFSRLRDFRELDELYPASARILHLWFSHYWGKGATTVLGWGTADDADEILARAEAAFETGLPGPGSTRLSAWPDRSSPLEVANPRLREAPPLFVRAR